MFPPRDSRRQTADFRISGAPAEYRRYTCPMPFKASLGRVGGLTVALGVGAAVMTGWHSGVAWADETGGTAGSTTSDTATGSEPKDDPPDKTAPPTTHDAETPTEAVEPPKVDTDETPPNKPARKKGSDTPAAKPTKPKPPTAPTASDAKRDTETSTATTHEKATAADTARPDQTPPSVASLHIASVESSPIVTMTTQSTSKP